MTYIEDLSIIKNRNQKARAKKGMESYRGREDNSIRGEEMSPEEFSRLGITGHFKSSYSKERLPRSI